MSILDSLKRVKKQLLANQHPLADRLIEFRETYALGYAMLVCVNGHPNEIAKDAFKKQIVQLDLPESFAKEAIGQALLEEDTMIQRVLKALQEPVDKYIFMLDLYCLAQQDQKMTDKEQELIVLFEELLQLSYVEVQFIRGFRLAVLKNDGEVAVKVVQTAIDQQLHIPHAALTYFLEGFEYEERLLSIHLHSGQKRVLHYKTLIKGEVVVGAGAELDLNGMDVRFADNASIIVNGGLLKADGAKFVASLDANKTMLVIRNTAALRIENAAFHGANIVRAVEVADTPLQFVNCTFERCYDEERGGAVYVASGERFEAQGCVFEHCTSLGKGGALYIAGSAAAHMKGFQFLKRFTEREKKMDVLFADCQLKACIADQGGGMYMYSANSELKNVEFDRCKGRAGAAALDVFASTMQHTNVGFKHCLATAPFAVAMVKGTNIKEQTQIGKFEFCEGPIAKILS